MSRSDRVRYLLYRCYNCQRLITKLEIIDRWEKAEAGNPENGVCPCGSGKISPTNAKLWEELFLPRVWKLWWNEIARPKLAR
jgi:hypothetical protein